MAPHFIKEVTRTGDTLKTIDVIGDKTFTTPNTYSYFMLDMESDEWAVRIYPIPSANNDNFTAEMNTIFADMKEFGTTIAYVTKDSSFTAISIRDNGVARPWDPEKKDLGPVLKNLSIDMSAKIGKRLSMLGQETYLHAALRVEFIEDDRIFAPTTMKSMLVKKGNEFVQTASTYTIRVTHHTDGEDCRQDGEFYIRPELRDRLVREAVARVDQHDSDKADRLARDLMSGAYNARLVTARGTLKGDAVVSSAITTDVQVCADCNIKTEVKTKNPHMGLFQMFPQEQKDRVVTNRQTVSSFYEWLFAVSTPGVFASEGLVKDALHAQVGTYIENMKTGSLMSHVNPDREEDDAIRLAHQKMAAWVNSGRPLTESLYLSMMSAGQVIDMMGCPTGTDDKKRRFPVPFARRVSLRNVHSYEMAYGVTPELKGNEAFVDEALGLIVPDDIFVQAAEILGGADKDDHVEVHYRIAQDDDKYFGIKAGDVVLVIIRNPIGITSDGSKVASEYFILKLAKFQDSGDDLPAIEMANRPLCTGELTLPEPTFIESDRDLPSSYTKKFLIEGVDASAKAQAVYGTHANLMMGFALYGIPFPFVAQEETFVDVCQQTRNPKDLAFVHALNSEHRNLLASSLVERGIEPDTWVKKRCGLKKLEAGEGLFDELVGYHKDQLRRFVKEARVILSTIKDDLAAAHANPVITMPMDNLPYVIGAYSLTKEFYKRQNGKGKLSHNDFELIGTMMVDRLSEKFPQDTISEMFREAYAYIWSNVRISTRQGGSIRSMFYDTDQQIMAGSMFDELITALS